MEHTSENGSTKNLTERDPDFEKLLLQEYDYISRCFIGNEELGERRVNLFITLTTAVLTILAAIMGTEIPVLGVEADPKLFLVGSTVLFLFGMVTLMRIIHRNIETDKFLQKLDSIRTYFVSSDDERLQYLPFNPYGEKKQRRIKRDWKAIFSLGTGGLLQTVVLMNSLIVAAFAISLSSLISFNAERIVQIAFYGFLGLAVFVAGWAGQMIYVRNRYDKEIEKEKKQRMHLEIRWFYRGSIHSNVNSWFKELLGENIITEERRADIYFLAPACQELGIKLREGKLEIKWRKDSSSVGCNGTVAGKAENWTKWAWEDSEPEKNSFFHKRESDRTMDNR